MATLRSRTKFNLSLVTLTLRLRRPSPARMCRSKRPQGAQSHAERRVRPDAQAVGLGLGGTPTSEPEYPKRIFRLIACLRYRKFQILPDFPLSPPRCLENNEYRTDSNLYCLHPGC